MIGNGLLGREMRRATGTPHTFTLSWPPVGLSQDENVLFSSPFFDQGYIFRMTTLTALFLLQTDLKHNSGSLGHSKTSTMETFFQSTDDLLIFQFAILMYSCSYILMSYVLMM